MSEKKGVPGWTCWAGLICVAHIHRKSSHSAIKTLMNLAYASWLHYQQHSNVFSSATVPLTFQMPNIFLPQLDFLKLPNQDQNLWH